ncbi:MAG: hypothetical protein AB8Y83_00720 [Coxiella endosymbiont of Haemaphysalis qinghaiensis]
MVFPLVVQEKYNDWAMLLKVARFHVEQPLLTHVNPISLGVIVFRLA